MSRFSVDDDLLPTAVVAVRLNDIQRRRLARRAA